MEEKNKGLEVHLKTWEKLRILRERTEKKK